MLKRCSTYHVILEGSGFIASVKRSALAAIFLTSGRRGTVFVHSNVGEVLASVKADALEEVTNLLRAVETKGLLKAAAPLASAPIRTA